MVVHKSEARVRLDLATPADVEEAASEMTADYAAAGHAIEGFVVQPMVPSGIELLVGVVHDRLFGLPRGRSLSMPASASNVEQPRDTDARPSR